MKTQILDLDLASLDNVSGGCRSANHPTAATITKAAPANNLGIATAPGPMGSGDLSSLFGSMSPDQLMQGLESLLQLGSMLNGTDLSSLGLGNIADPNSMGDLGALFGGGAGDAHAPVVDPMHDSASHVDVSDLPHLDGGHVIALPPAALPVASTPGGDVRDHREDASTQHGTAHTLDMNAITDQIAGHTPYTGVGNYHELVSK
jgi:hypothetical protein